MHDLHDHIVQCLAGQVAKHRIVVWYDSSSEFAPFVGELRGGPRIDSAPVPICMGGETVQLLEFDGSMFELRFVAEPFVAADRPAAVVLYLPGCTRAPGSVLCELEKAGTRWEPGLRHLARELLQERTTVGVVDDLLAPERDLDYADLARIAAEQDQQGVSLLRSLFPARGDDDVLAAWIASDERDADIVAKAATGELLALVRSTIGLDLPAAAKPTKLRGITARYVLAGEFRSDLTCAPPASVANIAAPPTPLYEQAIRRLAQRLRADYGDAYPALADRVDSELGLRDAEIPADALGSIDTFRFEERVLLGHCGDLIAAGRFDEALAIIAPRERSFWLDLDASRKAQWGAARLMAELGQVAAQVLAELNQVKGAARAWVERYTARDSGWYRLDQAQRRLEAWLTQLYDVPDRPLGVVRRAYEDVCQAMAEGFTQALVGSDWSVPGVLPQTRIFADVVSTLPKPVAYFFVDAMRYEMGIDLADMLPATAEVTVRPALGSLPSITLVGMAALHPGADLSFSVVEQRGKLGALIEGVFLPDLPARQKFAKSRIPDLVDISLDELLSLSEKKLRNKIGRAKVVIVRSQEIDYHGEAGFAMTARRVMDAAIGNIAMAIRRLAKVGVAHAVVTADHGHLFAAVDRDESLRADSPGGQTIDLHRRVWVGRGGANPPKSVRVSAAALGYDSDLALVFPPGASVFKAGGDLAFHHGGPTLQELVIPVVTVRTKAAPAVSATAAKVTVGGVPDSITNRIFPATLSIGAQLNLLAEGGQVRPVLVAGGQNVGTVGMADGADLDVATGCVRLDAAHEVTVWFRLIDDEVDAVRIVVLDPATDVELYRSPTDIPVRLGVR